MANFSGALKISDLNDFINPSQECVKPVVIERTDHGDATIKGTIEIDEEGMYTSVKNGKKVEKLKKVEITLNDCLACSGCITTAETILVSQQSQEELYKVLLFNTEQTNASLYCKNAWLNRHMSSVIHEMRRCGHGKTFKMIPSLEALLSLIGYKQFVSIGCSNLSFESMVCNIVDHMTNDTSLRMNAQINGGADRRVVVVSVSPPSRASIAAHYRLSLAQTASRLAHFFKTLGVDYVFDTTFANDMCLLQSCREFVARYNRRKQGDHTALPMLASQCPGWICYAEKTHGSYILPYLSSAKSPQQITGSLVKHHLAETLRVPPSSVYHVTIMPCYDKKLEASRADFYNDEFSTRDVDCVLTTGEVLRMLEREDYSLVDGTDTNSVDQIYPDPSVQGHSALYKHEGGASGGYLEHITKYAAKQIFDQQLDALEYKVLRNKDMQEVTVAVGGEVVLRMAAAYGFRNIQIIVQKIKRGKCPYDYVEIMACPSGCNNGGGQIAADSTETTNENLERVNQSYESIASSQPEDNPLVQVAVDDWLGGWDSDKCVSMLETGYHPVEKTENLLNIAW